MPENTITPPVDYAQENENLKVQLMDLQKRFSAAQQLIMEINADKVNLQYQMKLQQVEHDSALRAAQVKK